MAAISSRTGSASFRPNKINPITGKPEPDAPKIKMPIMGKAAVITDKLNEMNVRKERMEIMNYQQKMVNQQ